MNSIFQILNLLFWMVQSPYANDNMVLDIQLNEESYVEIHGKTNVNQFHCNYLQFNPNETIQVAFIPVMGKIHFKDTRLEINTVGFDCGNKMMNQDLQQLLKEDQFPQMYLALHYAEINPEGRTLIKVRITIAENTREYSFPINQVVNGHNTTYSGSIPLNIRDFGIDPPKKMLGMVVVDEWIEIEFHLVTTILDQ